MRNTNYFVLLSITMLALPCALYASKIEDETEQQKENSTLQSQANSNSAKSPQSYESYLNEQQAKYDKWKKQRDYLVDEIKTLKEFEAAKKRLAELDQQIKDTINEIKSTKETKDISKLSEKETLNELMQEKNKETDLLRKKMNAQTKRYDSEREYNNVKNKITNLETDIKRLIQDGEDLKASYITTYGDQVKLNKRIKLKSDVELEQNNVTHTKNNLDQAEKDKKTLNIKDENLDEQNRQLKERFTRTRNKISPKGIEIFTMAQKYVNKEITKDEFQKLLIVTTQKDRDEAIKASTKYRDFNAENAIRDVYDDSQTTHLQNYGTLGGIAAGFVVAMLWFRYGNDAIAAYNKWKGN